MRILHNYRNISRATKQFMMGDRFLEKIMILTIREHFFRPMYYNAPIEQTFYLVSIQNILINNCLPCSQEPWPISPTDITLSSQTTSIHFKSPPMESTTSSCRTSMTKQRLNATRMKLRSSREQLMQERLHSTKQRESLYLSMTWVKSTSRWEAMPVQGTTWPSILPTRLEKSMTTLKFADHSAQLHSEWTKNNKVRQKKTMSAYSNIFI